MKCAQTVGGEPFFSENDFCSTVFFHNYPSVAETYKIVLYYHITNDEICQ